MNKKYVVELNNVTVNYGEAPILDNLSLKIEKGKFYTLLGESGCGKTTMLKSIGGQIRIESGSIILNNQDVTNIPSRKRALNTVFQNYALFDHLNVFENVAFGLRVSKVPEAKIKKRVQEALNLVSLSDFAQKQISQLSGGQKQRVAIARAIIKEPEVLLLDEPLSALDLNLRTEMQFMLKKLQQKLGITFIFVTHDQEEALALSDYIYIINKGEIEQFGTPKDIYDNPVNRYVANFIGESNIKRSNILKSGIVLFNNIELEYQIDDYDQEFIADEIVDIVIRPEDLNVKEAGQGFVDVEIISKLFRGMTYEYVAKDKNNYEWLIQTTKNLEESKVVSLTIDKHDVHVMKVDNLG